MNITKIILIAVALAMDAFAVSISVGMSLRSVDNHQRFRLSWHFGLFQALMPVVGWFAGNSIYNLIERYDHWIAFGLLTLIGIHMIQDVFHETRKDFVKDPTKGISLVLLSVATSIDALAVGFSISMLNVSIVLPAIIIGFIASSFTLLGLQIGVKIGEKVNLNRYAQSIGGIILIIIGLNILYKS